VLIRLIHSLYRVQTSIDARRSVRTRQVYYVTTLEPQTGLEVALADLGMGLRAVSEGGINARLVQTEETATAYLRGAFLGAGYIADPRQKLHFELACPNQPYANGLVALLARQGINARAAEWHSRLVVYLKGAEPQVRFLAYAGASQAVLAFENVRVTKSIRSEENRLVNAEMANQNRSIGAALAQLRDIQALAEKDGGLDILPPALKELALLRLAHPDASIKVLGEMATPPLSKSAVAHRVRRLQEIVREKQ
jgi:DNA-binding protein WhiA